MQRYHQHFASYPYIHYSLYRQFSIFEKWEIQIFFFVFFFFFFSFGLHVRHMKVPGLGVESELQLHNHSNLRSEPHLQPTPQLSQQCQILNPLSWDRDRTQVLMDTSQIHFCCTMTGAGTLGIQFL